MIGHRSSVELDKMHQANAIVLDTLHSLKSCLEPGMTTAELDRIASEALTREGAKSAFKGYRGFPASLCVSVNEEVVHGIPSHTKRLADGDIVSLDFGAIVDGYYGDNALTAGVGETSEELQKLLTVTEEAMFKGIEAMVPGNHISDIGYAVQSHAERNGYTVVRDFVGHGIGRALHEDPPVPNFVQSGPDPKLATGMCLAVEPMVNTGKCHVKTLADQWTVVTSDGGFSAHFERSVAITDDGPWILAESRPTYTEGVQFA